MDAICRNWPLPERWSAAEDARLGPRHRPHRWASEESVVFDAFLPEILALVATVEVELDHVLVVALSRQITKQRIMNEFIHKSFRIDSLRVLPDGVWWETFSAWRTACALWPRRTCWFWQSSERPPLRRWPLPDSMALPQDPVQPEDDGWK